MMKNKLLLYIVGIVVLLVLPHFAQYFGDAWVRILDTALLYMLLALGLNIVVGYAGLLDLGYVAFYAIGAYMFGLLASPHLTENFAAVAAMFPQGLHMPLWIVIPAGADPDVVAKLEAGGAEVVQDPRPRREAVGAMARADDLVLVPSRPGRSPLHRDAGAIAALPVGCSVAVPTRPHTGAGLVTGTTTLVGSRRTA